MERLAAELSSRILSGEYPWTAISRLKDWGLVDAKRGQRVRVRKRTRTRRTT
jgi:hypothetical protein